MPPHERRDKTGSVAWEAQDCVNAGKTNGYFQVGLASVGNYPAAPAKCCTLSTNSAVYSNAYCLSKPLISFLSPQLWRKANTRSCQGRVTCGLDRTGCTVSPRLIFRQFSLLPGCVASTKVLLGCSVKALKHKKKWCHCLYRKKQGWVRDISSIQGRRKQS